MPRYRVKDQSELNTILDDDRLKDDMRLELSGLKLSAATVGELRKSQGLPFPLLVETPRVPYPEATLKVRLPDQP